jgi:hypothetical protein
LFGNDNVHKIWKISCNSIQLNMFEKTSIN